MKVFVNPGHCPGIDPGAVNEEIGLEEAAVVYEVGRLVADYLDKAGCEVYLCQSDNLYFDGEGECVVASANAWPADVFISLHCNAFNGNAKGTETCVYSTSGESGKLGQCIQTQLIDTIGTVNRGIKERPGLIVLKHTTMPAALVEIAFIDNEDDAAILVDKKDEIARAIARGITDYLSQ